MPWREVSVMEKRREFIRLAEQRGSNRRELFRRFGISAETGYRWLRGEHKLADRSRRPASSPLAVLPSWKPPCLRSATRPSVVGRGKLRRCLERASISPPALPSPGCSPAEPASASPDDPTLPPYLRPAQFPPA